MQILVLCLQSLQIDFFFIKELDVVIPVKRHRPWMISISDKIVSDIV